MVKITSEKWTSGDPEILDIIKSSSINKYNEYCVTLLTEAKVYLSYFEAEKYCEKECELVYKDSMTGPSFACIQKAMFEALSLSLARLFDDMCKYAEKYTIYDLLKKALEEKDMLQCCVDNYENECGNVESKIKEFQDMLGTPEIKDILNRIKEMRNKFLAHNDKEKCDWATYGVTIQELKRILNLAFAITNYFHCCLTNHYYPTAEDGSVMIDGLYWFLALFKVADAGVTTLTEKEAEMMAKISFAKSDK